MNGMEGGDFISGKEETSMEDVITEEEHVVEGDELDAIPGSDISSESDDIPIEDSSFYGNEVSVDERGRRSVMIMGERISVLSVIEEEVEVMDEWEVMDEDGEVMMDECGVLQEVEVVRKRKPPGIPGWMWKVWKECRKCWEGEYDEGLFIYF